MKGYPDQPRDIGETRPFQLRERRGGGYALGGDLTFATAEAALKTTAPLFRTGLPLRFDLDSIVRVDSAGVALLIEWLRRAETAGGIRFSHLPEPLRAIARVSGVEHLLPIDP